MFIDLTHYETGHTISIKISSIDAIDQNRDGTTIRAGSLIVTVRETRKEILELIKQTKKGKSNGQTHVQS